MKIEVRVVEGVAIASLEGRLQGGESERALHELVDNLLADGHRQLLLDLSQVPSIDSAGVGELVASRKVCQELDAQLKILRIPEGVRHVLHMAQLLPLFEIHRSETEALEAFRGPAEQPSG